MAADKTLTQIGPQVVQSLYCTGCKYLVDKHGGGGDGTEYSCAHPAIRKKMAHLAISAYLGMIEQRSTYKFQTPDWCPVLVKQNKASKLETVHTVLIDLSRIIIAIRNSRAQHKEVLRLSDEAGTLVRQAASGVVEAKIYYASLLQEAKSLLAGMREVINMED